MTRISTPGLGRNWNRRERSGPAFTVIAAWPSRPRRKPALWQSTGADAVEMESSVIRNICREQKIPSATIRVISDDASQDLPLDFNAMMTPEDRIHYPKLIWAVLSRPGADRADDGVPAANGGGVAAAGRGAGGTAGRETRVEAAKRCEARSSGRDFEGD